MCSLHLTHPSGAVGSQYCSAQGAVGGSVPCSRVSPQSWTLPARAGIRTHNLGLPRVSNPTLYPLGHDCHYTSTLYSVIQPGPLDRIAFSLQPNRSRVSFQLSRDHRVQAITDRLVWCGSERDCRVHICPNEPS